MLMLAAEEASAADYFVYPDGSGDAPTIQGAIDLTISGDVVYIAEGTYHEEYLLVDGKDIFIYYNLSTGYPVIEAPTPGSATGITFNNTSGSFMWGVDFTGFDTGVAVIGSDVQVWYCEIKGCTVGLSVTGASSPSFSGILIEDFAIAADFSGSGSIDFRNMTVAEGTTGISITSGTVDVSRSIIYRCVTGAFCGGGSIMFYCNDFWENTTDYNGCTPGADDFSEIPMFCYEAGGSPGLYWLHVDSPCWGSNNTCGVNVGAFTGSPGCSGTAAEDASWGQIKNLYTE